MLSNTNSQRCAAGKRNKANGTTIFRAIQAKPRIAPIRPLFLRKLSFGCGSLIESPHIKLYALCPLQKRSLIPETRVKNPEPKKYNEDWIIWAGWADRITFEEIEKKTGKNESQVIKIMRKNLKPSSFRLWRKRVHKTSIKHRKKFKLERKKMREKIRISDIY